MALAALLLVVGLSACVDRGGSFVADNRSDVAVLARIRTTVSTESGLETAHEVVKVPAGSRLVIAVQGFTGPVVNEIEVLLESCALLADFFGFAKSGSLIRIEDGPTATLVPEWPQDTDPRAAVVDACPTPGAVPSP